MKRLWRKIVPGWPFGLLFLLAAGFLWKVVLLGQVLVPADTLLVMTPWKFYAQDRFPEFRRAQNGLLDPVQQYYPWRHYATGSLKEGVIPLWNPYMFCGTPFVANQQSTVFYPPNLLFLLTSVAKGFGYSALLHLTLLGWGTFLFLRELGLRRGAATVGATAFMFNGYVIAWLEFPAFSLWVATWLPWVLWLFERAWQKAEGRKQKADREGAKGREGTRNTKGRNPQSDCEIRESWRGRRPAGLAGTETSPYFTPCPPRLCGSCLFFSAIRNPQSAIRNPQSAIRNPGLWVGLCGVAWGLQFLGGQLQVSFYLLLAFGSYGLFRILTSRQMEGKGREGEGRGRKGKRSWWVGGLAGWWREQHGVRSLRQLTNSPTHQLINSPLTLHWPGAIALYLLLPVLLGGLLAGAHLGPSLELVPLTERGDRISWAFIRQQALPLWQLITLILPHFFGNSAWYGLYWGHYNFIELCGYVGVTTLLLALFAVGCPASPARRRLVWFFLGLAIFSLLMATATPLYLVFYHLVPGFKQLGGAARILLLNAFALSALAAFGVDCLLDLPRRPPPVPPSQGGEDRIRRYGRLALRVLPGLLFAAVLAAVVREALRFTGPEQFNFFNATELLPGVSIFAYELKNLALATVLVASTLALLALRLRGLAAAKFLGGLVGLVVVDLFTFGLSFNPAVPPGMAYFDTPPVAFLQRQDPTARMVSVARLPEECAAQGKRYLPFLDWMPPNTPMVYRLQDMNGSDSLRIGHYYRLLRAFGPEVGGPEWKKLHAPLLDMLGVRYVLTPRTLTEERFREVFADRGLHVYKNRQALPRAYAVTRWRALPGEEAVLAALTQPTFDPRREVLLLAVASDSGFRIQDSAGRGLRPRRRARPPSPPGFVVPKSEFQKPNSEIRTTKAHHEGTKHEIALQPFEVTFPSPNQVTARGSVARDSLLFLSEAYYPGWRAFVDGQLQPIQRANYSFQAVSLPPGEHEVRFVYHPTSFRAGLFASLVTLLGLVAAAVGGVVRRWSRHD